MNTINASQSSEQTLTDRCVQSCKKLLAGIKQARSRIAAEFREKFESQQNSFQQALNEAEALAFQTEYPHLVFPALAMEKVQAAAAWQTRQRAVYQHQPIYAAAA
jgi:hypothetical protein